MIVPTDSISTAQPRPFVTGRSNETDIALSHSGKILAYVSDETGTQEVYLRPVPGPGPRVRVSVAGGITPSWSRDGRSLYFISGTHLMSASITDEPELAVTRRDSVVHATIVSEGTNYAVMPEGSGFIAALGSPARPVNPFRLGVISNWQSLFSKQ
jgi:eukaryotic-like serine/threonine-protein kinase